MDNGFFLCVYCWSPSTLRTRDRYTLCRHPEVLCKYIRISHRHTNIGNTLKTDYSNFVMTTWLSTSLTDDGASSQSLDRVKSWSFIYPAMCFNIDYVGHGLTLLSTIHLQNNILWRICSGRCWAAARWARSSAWATRQCCGGVSFVSAHGPSLYNAWAVT
jgi:hypothetical protein